MNYLVEQGLDKTFVKKLVERAISPDMLHNIQTYEWDKVTMTITAPQDKENKKKTSEHAAWYKDEFGSHIANRGKRKQ